MGREQSSTGANIYTLTNQSEQLNITWRRIDTHVNQECSWRMSSLFGSGGQSSTRADIYTLADHVSSKTHECRNLYALGEDAMPEASQFSY
ncbi:hypothetical protein V6N12_055546 [Hibiscus sabdariffa]|uniref:Uncharacterized protein n=1 Tax=Hibiscus sabdariffa TaxID=183260 RepID=A0ABR2BU04_9ROSI